MKQSGNGYKLSKFVQKIFADFIGDGSAIDDYPIAIVWLWACSSWSSAL